MEDKKAWKNEGSEFLPESEKVKLDKKGVVVKLPEKPVEEKPKKKKK